MQLLFNIFAGFSGVSYFHSMYVAGWAVITVFPALSLSFDKDVSERAAHLFPSLYTEGQRGQAPYLPTAYLPTWPSYPPTCLPVPTYPPTHLPTDPPTHRPTDPPTHLPTHPPTYRPTHRPPCPHPPTPPPPHPPPHPPTHPPTHLPTHPPTHLPTSARPSRRAPSAGGP